MNTDTVLAVAFIGVTAFGLAGIALAVSLVRRGWRVRSAATRLTLGR